MTFRGNARFGSQIFEAILISVIPIIAPKLYKNFSKIPLQMMGFLLSGRLQTLGTLGRVKKHVRIKVEKF